MRYPVLISTVALCLFVTPLAAKEPFRCTLDNNYCTPFMGCIDENSILFIGYTFGRKSGALVARTNTGATCAGRWRRTAFGGGRANFSCDDGRAGRVRYTTLHQPTGTAVGKGRTKTGEKVNVWSGSRILEYLARDQQLNRDVATCGRAVFPTP